MSAYTRLSAGSRIGEFRARDMTAAWRHVDYYIIVAMILLSGTGAALVHSASRFFPEGSYLPRQSLFLLAGAAICVLFASVDYSRWLKASPVMYIGAVGILGLVLVAGRSVNNTKGWFVFGPIQLQPAEPAKIAVILALAAFLGRDEATRGFRTLVGALVIVGLPMGLILLQPDLGSVLVYLLIAAGMLFAGGIKGRYLVALVLIAVAGTTMILKSDALAKYQRERLTVFTQKNCPASDQACYNVRQAQIAVSSGGLTGYGYGQGPQTRAQFVPEQETDFIFTVAGEEFGFVGSSFIILLYGLLCWRLWYTGMVAPDRAGQLICAGVMCMLMFHVFENIGMSMGMMPVTGIPLPFISSGGSSLITVFMAMGLVQNVHMRQWSR